MAPTGHFDHLPSICQQYPATRGILFRLPGLSLSFSFFLSFKVFERQILLNVNQAIDFFFYLRLFGVVWLKPEGDDGVVENTKEVLNHNMIEEKYKQKKNNKKILKHFQG